MRSDDELYRRYLAGDTASYDELMLRHGDHLLFYLNKYLHDPEDSEDLMIEAFARIMARRPDIREGNFKAYLFRTGRNLALRLHERRHRLQMFSMDGMERNIADSILASASGDQADSSRIPDRLAAEERNRILLQCLERIDPGLREALWLVYAEEMTYAQAAEVIGVRPKRIDRMLARGKKLMRQELGKEGVDNAY